MRFLFRNIFILLLVILHEISCLPLNSTIPVAKARNKTDESDSSTTNITKPPHPNEKDIEKNLTSTSTTNTSEKYEEKGSHPLTTELRGEEKKSSAPSPTEGQRIEEDKQSPTSSTVNEQSTSDITSPSTTNSKGDGTNTVYTKANTTILASKLDSAPVDKTTSANNISEESENNNPSSDTTNGTDQTPANTTNSAPPSTTNTNNDTADVDKNISLSNTSKQSENNNPPSDTENTTEQSLANATISAPSSTTNTNNDTAHVDTNLSLANISEQSENKNTSEQSLANTTISVPPSTSNITNDTAHVNKNISATNISKQSENNNILSDTANKTEQNPENITNSAPPSTNNTSNETAHVDKNASLGNISKQSENNKTPSNTTDQTPAIAINSPPPSTTDTNKDTADVDKNISLYNISKQSENNNPPSDSENTTEQTPAPPFTSNTNNDTAHVDKNSSLSNISEHSGNNNTSSDTANTTEQTPANTTNSAPPSTSNTDNETSHVDKNTSETDISQQTTNNITSSDVINKTKQIDDNITNPVSPNAIVYSNDTEKTETVSSPTNITERIENGIITRSIGKPSEQTTANTTKPPNENVNNNTEEFQSASSKSVTSHSITNSSKQTGEDVFIQVLSQVIKDIIKVSFREPKTANISKHSDNITPRSITNLNEEISTNLNSIDPPTIKDTNIVQGFPSKNVSKVTGSSVKSSTNSSTNASEKNETDIFNKAARKAVRAITRIGNRYLLPTNVNNQSDYNFTSRNKSNPNEQVSGNLTAVIPPNARNEVNTVQEDASPTNISIQSDSIVASHGSTNSSKQTVTDIFDRVLAQTIKDIIKIGLESPSTSNVSKHNDTKITPRSIRNPNEQIPTNKKNMVLSNASKDEYMVGEKPSKSISKFSNVTNSSETTVMDIFNRGILQATKDIKEIGFELPEKHSNNHFTSRGTPNSNEQTVSKITSLVPQNTSNGKETVIENPAETRIIKNVRMRRIVSPKKQITSNFTTFINDRDNKNFRGRRPTSRFPNDVLTENRKDKKYRQDRDSPRNPIGGFTGKHPLGLWPIPRKRDRSPKIPSSEPLIGNKVQVPTSLTHNKNINISLEEVPVKLKIPLKFPHPISEGVLQLTASFVPKEESSNSSFFEKRKDTSSNFQNLGINIYNPNLVINTPKVVATGLDETLQGKTRPLPVYS